MHAQSPDAPAPETGRLQTACVGLAMMILAGWIFFCVQTFLVLD